MRMRKKFLISAMVSSMFLLATLATGLAQTLDLKLTGCINKKGKLRRVEIGTQPRKGDCKGNHELIMIPLTNKTDELMAKDTAQDVEIANNSAAIGANADMIDDIKEELISSMWGGGHRRNETFSGGVTFSMPLYDSFFCESGDLFKCESKIAVSGKITKLVVLQQDTQDPGDAVQYDFIVNGAIAPLNTDTEEQCRIGGDSVMCETNGCIDVTMGDMVAVGGVAVTVEGPDVGVRPARWTARFVEGGTCGPPPPPDNICTDFECPENSELMFCDPDEGLTCQGEGANCQTDNCPEGTILTQCDGNSFTCEVVVEG